MKAFYRRVGWSLMRWYAGPFRYSWKLGSWIYDKGIVR